MNPVNDDDCSSNECHKISDDNVSDSPNKSLLTGDFSSELTAAISNSCNDSRSDDINTYEYESIGHFVSNNNEISLLSHPGFPDASYGNGPLYIPDSQYNSQIEYEFTGNFSSDETKMILDDINSCEYESINDFVSYNDEILLLSHPGIPDSQYNSQIEYEFTGNFSSDEANMILNTLADNNGTPGVPFDILYQLNHMVNIIENKIISMNQMQLGNVLYNRCVNANLLTLDGARIFKTLFIGGRMSGSIIDNTLITAFKTACQNESIDESNFRKTFYKFYLECYIMFHWKPTCSIVTSSALEFDLCYNFAPKLCNVQQNKIREMVNNTKGKCKIYFDNMIEQIFSDQSI